MSDDNAQAVLRLLRENGELKKIILEQQAALEDYEDISILYADTMKEEFTARETLAATAEKLKALGVTE